MYIYDKYYKHTVVTANIAAIICRPISNVRLLKCVGYGDAKLKFHSLVWNNYCGNDYYRLTQTYTCSQSSLLYVRACISMLTTVDSARHCLERVKGILTIF